METRFLFKGVEVDTRTREYIVKRLERVEKIIHESSRIETEIDKDKKGKFRVEVMIREPRRLFRSEETTESIEGSIDSVADELERQITQEKDRRLTLKRRGARSIKKKLVVDASARF
jgi:ribosomal subunit interface protein